MDALLAPFTLNCSRIPPQGGLRSFANEMMRAVITLGYDCQAVVPSGFSTPAGVRVISTPPSLAGASNVSLLRPLKWLAYSRFQFPVPSSQRILCTTHHVLPGRSNQIVTVHDLRPFFYPDTPIQSFYFRKMLPSALHRCDGVLTVSESSRQLVAEVYKLPLDRIAVIPNVIDLATRDHIEVPVEPSGKPFLLTVGASWSHKNIESLLERHSLWSSRFDLKVVAGKGQYRTKMERLTQSLGISQQVNFFHEVLPEDLDQLYAGCAAVIAPSRMEGFGLPPLEAMMRGRPVIVADIPVLHELYGEHAIYVRTDDTDSWVEAFNKLPSISALHRVRAKAHAATFSHSRMAESLGNALATFWNL